MTRAELNQNSKAQDSINNVHQNSEYSTGNDSILLIGTVCTGTSKISHSFGLSVIGIIYK